MKKKNWLLTIMMLTIAFVCVCLSACGQHKHTIEVMPGKEATCTETGLTEGEKCSECGEIIKAQETIPAKGHSWNAGLVTKEATCTEDGVKTYTCTVCGETKTEVVSATGHVWNDGEVTKEPTCAEEGVKTMTCAKCGETKTEAIAKIEHTWNAGIVTKYPTCTESGTSTYTCMVCGETKTENIPAKGHSWNNGVVTKEATCTEMGLRTVTCLECGETNSETILAKGHSWDNGEETNPATCTETGVKTFTCTVCKETKTETIPAKGHSWNNGEVTKEATCKETGVRTFTCTVCKETKTETIEKLPHTEEVIPAVAATCTETGLTEGKKCSVCNEIIKAQEVVSAKGHKEQTIPAVAATCTETGLTEGKKCSVCNEILTAQTVVPAKGHKEQTIPAVPATCTETGLTEGKKCSVCNEILTAQTVVSALGHSMTKTEAKTANCTTAGNSAYYTCSRCNKYFSDENGTNEIAKDSWVIKALGHNMTKTNAVAASCTTAGNSEYYTCSRCNKYFSDAQGKTEITKDSWIIPAKGHTEQTIPAKAATCTETGLTEGKKCSVCNEILTAQTVVPAKGHTNAAAVEENRKNATCTTAGSYDEVVYCSVCNAEISRTTKTITALGHSMTKTQAKAPTYTEDGNSEYYTCSRCNKYFSDAEGKTEIAKDSWVLPKIVQYTVTFVDWDNTVLKTEKVDSSKGATAPSDPTRGGYTFKGWDKTFSAITADTTVTATYEMLTDPMILVESVKAKAGETVDVKVYILNNPGVAVANPSIQYNATALTVTAVSYGTDYSSGEAPNLKAVPLTPLWLDTQNNNANGIFVTITFKVSDSVAVGTKLVLGVGTEGGFFDVSDNEVEMTPVQGTITIVE